MSKNITSATPYGTTKFNSDLIGIDFEDQEKPIFRFSTLNVLPIFNIEAYGAIGNDPTFDSSTAIQNAIIAAQNGGGGRVFIPGKTYYLNNTLNVLKNNCQVYIPEQNLTNLQRNTIIIEGATPTSASPVFGNPGFHTIDLIETGSRLISTITGSGTEPSIFSGIPGSGGFNFHYGDIYFLNITILAKNVNGNGPTLTAINGKYWHHLGVKGCLIGINDGPENVTDLTAECAGIIMGIVNSDPPSFIKNTICFSYKYAYVVGELVDLDYAQAWRCINCFTFTKGYYPNVGRNIFSLWSKYAINIPNSGIFGITAGTTRLEISNIFREYYVSSAYYGGSYFINDPGNYGVGTVSYHSVTAGVGTDYTTFSKNGGVNILCRRMDSSIPEWTTSGRPGIYVTGVKNFGYNTTDNKLEYYNGSTWIQL